MTEFQLLGFLFVCVCVCVLYLKHLIACMCIHMGKVNLTTDAATENA
jgi:hypothetical protein